MHPMSTFTIYFARLAGLYFIILVVILVARERSVLELMLKLGENPPTRRGPRPSFPRLELRSIATVSPGTMRLIDLVRGPAG